MDADRTLYLRNITPDITESLLYELFLQAGPLEGVSIKGNIAFVTFEDEDSVLYSCSLFEGLKLYGNEVTVKPRAGSKFASARIPSVPPFYTLDTSTPHRNFSNDCLSRSLMGTPPGSLSGHHHASPIVVGHNRGDFNSPSSASYPLLPYLSSPYPASFSPVSPYWLNASSADERLNRSRNDDRGSHHREPTQVRHSGNRERSPFGIGRHSHSSPYGVSPLSGRGYNSHGHRNQHGNSNGHSHC